MELYDVFNIKAYNWEDDDLPLSYGFGYYTNTNSDDKSNGDINRNINEKVFLKLRSEENIGNFYLPTGNENQNGILKYFVDIFDSCGGYSLQRRQVWRDGQVRCVH